MEQLEGGEQQSAPVWAIFSDLMAALVGILALILVWVIGIQLELSQSLAEEIEKREAEEQRRIALEQALEDPLTKGLVTFRDGRTGISGNVLFELNSDQLQAEGEEVLESLISLLQTYLEQHDDLLMVSGFTDDLPMHPGNRYQDNRGLSARRARTVTRSLPELGLPNGRVFAAARGPHRAAVPNVDADSQAGNGRVDV